MLGHTDIPDSKVHGANMGPIWGRQDPGKPHAGPMNLDIWDTIHRDWLLEYFTKQRYKLNLADYTLVSVKNTIKSLI